MENKCSSDNCDKCFECGKYFLSHSPHYESYYGREVINIKCYYGGSRYLWRWNETAFKYNLSSENGLS